MNPVTSGGPPPPHEKGNACLCWSKDRHFPPLRFDRIKNLLRRPLVNYDLAVWVDGLDCRRFGAASRETYRMITILREMVLFPALSLLK